MADGSPGYRSGVQGAFLFAWLALAAAGAQAEGGALQSSTDESADGYYQLTWQAASPVRLLEATTADFADARVLYEGADTAAVISGKPDGRWFYRLESAESGAGLGEPIAVAVTHHSLQRALAFFSIGATVFVATLVLIVFGRRSADQ